MSSSKLNSLDAALRAMIRAEIERSAGMNLPCNVDAERSILGAILLDNQAFKEVALKADDFVLDSHERIFARMGQLIYAGRAIDIVTLAEELRKRKELDLMGGVAYIAYLTEGLPRRLSIEEYVRIVKEKALLRQIIHACSAAITRAVDEVLTPAEIVEQLGKDLKGVRGEK